MSGPPGCEVESCGRPGGRVFGVGVDCVCVGGMRCVCVIILTIPLQNR